MTRILVLYYSMYGHIEQMARAIAEGAASVDGVDVTVKRVPELVPREVAEKAGAKLDQEAPFADPQELADYDSIIFGTPTRSEEHTSELQSLMRISYAVFCLKKKKHKTELNTHTH